MELLFGWRNLEFYASLNFQFPLVGLDIIKVIFFPVIINDDDNDDRSEWRVRTDNIFPAVQKPLGFPRLLKGSVTKIIKISCM